MMSNSHHAPRGPIPPEAIEQSTSEKKTPALVEGEEGRDVKEEFGWEVEEWSRLRDSIFFLFAVESSLLLPCQHFSISETPIVDDDHDFSVWW